MGKETFTRKIEKIDRIVRHLDEYEIIIPLPFSNKFDYGISEDHFLYESIQMFDSIRRLNGVSQLVSHVDANPDYFVQEKYYTSFNQSRYYHSLLVSRVNQQILENNGFSGQEIKLGIIAGLLHDIATPAFGDATKNLDPESFHEKNNWKECITPKGWKYIQEHNINTDELDLIIKKDGNLGKLLDISDKISYTMVDLYNLINDFSIKATKREKFFLFDCNSEYKQKLVSIIEDDPKIGNIIKNVKFDKKSKKIYFDNPDRLEKFLMIKAFLNQNLYLNPVNQAKDFKITSLIEPFYKDGRLSSKKLRSMTDYELISFLAAQQDHESKKNNFLDLQDFLIQYHPQIIKFSSFENAKNFEANITGDSSINVVGIKECKGFKTGISYLVKNKEGELIPFSQYNPTVSKELELMSESTKGFYIFYENKKIA